MLVLCQNCKDYRNLYIFDIIYSLSYTECRVYENTDLHTKLSSSAINLVYFVRIEFVTV